MSEQRIFENKLLFILYGALNIVLIFALLILLILLLNDIYILSRIGFMIIVVLHLFLIFFIKIHYLAILYNDEKQKIEFHYNKRFGLKWKVKSKTVLLPLSKFDGYKLSKDSMGISVISFFKLELKERFELGPFHIGYVSEKERRKMEESFGEAL